MRSGGEAVLEWEVEGGLAGRLCWNGRVKEDWRRCVRYIVLLGHRRVETIAFLGLVYGKAGGEVYSASLLTYRLGCFWYLVTSFNIIFGKFGALWRVLFAAFQGYVSYSMELVT